MWKKRGWFSQRKEAEALSVSVRCGKGKGWMTHHSNIWHKRAKCTPRWGHGRAGPRRSLSGNSCRASLWESVRALSQQPQCLESAPGLQTLHITGKLALEASENVVVANTAKQQQKKQPNTKQNKKKNRLRTWKSWESKSILLWSKKCALITYLSLTFYVEGLVVWMTFQGGGTCPWTLPESIQGSGKGTRVS